MREQAGIKKCIVVQYMRNQGSSPVQDSRECSQKDSEEGEGEKEIRAASAQASEHEQSSVHPYTSTSHGAFYKPNKNSKNERKRRKELQEQEPRGKQAEGCEPM